MIDRITVESIADTIKSTYNINIEYDDFEQVLKKDYQFGYITLDEYKTKLNESYADIENQMNESE